MNDSGCAGPAVVDLILFCRAGFNLPCSFLSPLCLLTALRLPRRSQRESANRGDAQTAPRAGPQTPSPSLPASLSGCWSMSAAGVHSQAFWARFIPHLSSPPCACSAAAQWICSCFGDVCQQLCSSAQVHWLCFYQLLSGFLQSVLLPQQHSFMTPHSVCFWRVLHTDQQ